MHIVNSEATYIYYTFISWNGNKEIQLTLSINMPVQIRLNLEKCVWNDAQDIQNIPVWRNDTAMKTSL